MKTSVALCTYNGEQYLAEQLDSILSQSVKVNEIVVCDDGSSDNTFALANDLASKHAQVRAFSQPNSGVSAARNRALREAVGTYILPVDADDLISTTYIANAVSVLDARSEVKVVYAKAEFFGLRQGAWNLPTYSLHKLAMHNQIYVSAMYRKEDALAFGGYCETISGREDWEFWISLIETGSLVYRIPEVLFYYRQNRNSRSNKLAKENKKFQYSIVKKGGRSSQYIGGIQWLEDAGIVRRCYNTQITELDRKSVV